MTMFIGDWVSGPVLRRVSGIKTAKIHAIQAGEERYFVKIKTGRVLAKGGGNCPRRPKSDSGLC
jgi:hypothetical protein